MIDVKLIRMIMFFKTRQMQIIYRNIETIGNKIFDVFDEFYNTNKCAITFDVKVQCLLTKKVFSLHSKLSLLLKHPF